MNRYSVYRVLSPLAVAVALGYPGVAGAQDETLPPPVDDRGPNVEEQVVTGSRIITGESSVSPVEVFTGEAIFDAALPSLGDFIFEEVLQNQSASPNAQVSLMGGNAEGNRVVSANLRGLGAENTLVLVDSMRTVNYAVPDGNGWSSVDINATIPTIAMTRTELLLDGGSAVYGTDAIGGVVNLIPDYGLRGVKFQFNTLRDDRVLGNGDETFSLAGGFGNERTSLIAAVDVRIKDGVTDVELGTSDIDPFLTETNPVYIGEFNSYAFNGYNPMGMNANQQVDPLCGMTEAFPDEVPAYAGIIHEVAGRRGTTINCGISRLAGNTVQQAIESQTYFIALEHQFSDRIAGTINASYNETKMERPADFGGVLTPPLNGTDISLASNVVIPTTNPGLMYAEFLDPGEWDDPDGYTSSSYIGQVYQTPFQAEQNDDLFRIAAGLDFKLSENWVMILDAITAETNAEVHRRDYVVERFQAALNGLGGPDCTGSTPGANGCEWWNPFLSQALPNAETLGLANSLEVANWIQPEDTRDWKNELEAYQAVLSGVLEDRLELPGGPIGVAFGFEHREETTTVDYDALLNAGAFFRQGGFPLNDYKQSIEVDSWFGELALPVLDNLNVQVAFRSEDYSTGYSSTNPKIGFNWQANDRLTIRGSWGTSFKAPTVAQTLAPATILPSWINIAAPDQVANDGSGDTVNRGFGGGDAVIQPFGEAFVANPDLEPQESDNWSVGFDWRLTDNLSFGASLVSIDFTNLIEIPFQGDILLQCNLGTLADQDAVEDIAASGGRVFDSRFAILIPDPECFGMRNQPELLSEDTLAAVEAVTGLSDFDPYPSSVLIVPRNLASEKVEAIDWNLRYDLDLDFGTLTFSPNGTMYITSESQLTKDDPVVNTLGVSGTGFTNRTRHRINFPISLSMDNHRFSVTTRFTKGLDTTSPNGQDQDDTYSADLSYVWRINETYRVGATVRDVGFESGSRTFAINFEANFTE